MAILDNRTVLDAGQATTNWVSDAGAAFPGGTNSDTAIKGTVSIAERVSSGTLGFMVDLGATEDITDETFYFWWNVSTAGLLDTLANGGVRMRFAGGTITDFFEVHLAGNDTYSGGWTMSVVNATDARAAAVAADPNTGTGGTTPALTAIRYIGIFFDMASMVSGNVDNCFVDHCWRLAANTPGIQVQGNNAASPWTWQDLVDAADPGDTTKAWGTVFRRDGVVFINTPIQFGTNDATNADDQFTDSGEVVFWEDHRVPDTFYELEIVGASGASASQSFVLGDRSGSGATSTGNNGGVIGAPTTGFAPRWNLTVTDADVDQAEFLGVTMSHTNIIDVTQNNAEIRSCTLGDATLIYPDGSNGAGSGACDFSKNIVFGANTADGVALIQLDDPSILVENSFTFSDGHAIEVEVAGTYSFSGNNFNSYSTTVDNDKAIYFSPASGNLVLNASGTTNIAENLIRNGSSGTVTVNNNTQVTLTGLKDNTEVRVYTNGTTTELAGIENATTGTTDNRSFAFSLAASTVVDIVVFNKDWVLPPLNRITAFTIPGSDTSLPITQIADRNFSNP